jgi:ribosome-associated protein
MSRWRVPPGEVDFAAVRSQGPGGQNVNKVSSAAQLRFDIATSSLSQLDKEKLRVWADQRINREGTVVIKAQSQRSLAANQADALSRLQALIDRALQPLEQRVATKPTRASRQRRLRSKSLRSKVKALRRCGPIDGQ